MCSQNIEVFVPDWEVSHATALLENQFMGVCARIRTEIPKFAPHLTDMPAFKIPGLYGAFFIVSHHAYGLENSYTRHILYRPSLRFPIVPLPYYVTILAAKAVEYEKRNDNLNMFRT